MRLHAGSPVSPRSGLYKIASITLRNTRPSEMVDGASLFTHPQAHYCSRSPKGASVGNVGVHQVRGLYWPFSPTSPSWAHFLPCPRAVHHWKPCTALIPNWTLRLAYGSSRGFSRHSVTWFGSRHLAFYHLRVAASLSLPQPAQA